MSEAVSIGILATVVMALLGWWWDGALRVSAAFAVAGFVGSLLGVLLHSYWAPAVVLLCIWLVVTRVQKRRPPDSSKGFRRAATWLAVAALAAAYLGPLVAVLAGGFMLLAGWVQTEIKSIALTLVMLGGVAVGSSGLTVAAALQPMPEVTEYFTIENFQRPVDSDETVKLECGVRLSGTCQRLAGQVEGVRVKIVENSDELVSRYGLDLEKVDGPGATRCLSRAIQEMSDRWESAGDSRGFSLILGTMGPLGALAGSQEGFVDNIFLLRGQLRNRYLCSDI